jgi:hypothetical protein
LIEESDKALSIDGVIIDDQDFHGSDYWRGYPLWARNFFRQTMVLGPSADPRPIYFKSE